MRCRKRRYPTRVDALLALSRTELREKTTHNPQVARKRRESRAYRCVVCHGWHLTSRPVST